MGERLLDAEGQTFELCDPYLLSCPTPDILNAPHQGGRPTPPRHQAAIERVFVDIGDQDFDGRWRVGTEQNAACFRTLIDDSSGSGEQTPAQPRVRDGQWE